MGRVTRAALHLPLEVVQAKLVAAPNPTQRRSWWMVYNARVDPRPASSIALHTGVCVPTVRVVISRDTRLGPPAIETPGKGGRRHARLTGAEDQAFLAPFCDRAAQGQIATAAAMHAALQARRGQPIHLSTVQRMVARHGWRNRAPRPTHPTADPAPPAAVKNTALPRSPR